MRIDFKKTVRSRAPLRLGFAGGGTDLDPYSQVYGGAVLNGTIGRYAFTSMCLLDSDRLDIVSHDGGVAQSISPDEFEDLSFDVHANLSVALSVYRRICRDYLAGAFHPLRIETSVDAPPGSGLGSSSALAVAIVEAFAHAFDLPMGLYDVGRTAWEVERIDLRLAGGKQDQYAAAFGGINFIEFLPDDRTIVNPLRVSDSVLLELEASIVIAFTGLSRDTDAIIRDQIRSTEALGSDALEHLHALKAEAFVMKDALLRGHLDDVAEVINRSWQAKKKTSARMSNAAIDRLYDVAFGAGARAGKISGAGGGGFMMFMVDPSRRNDLRAALNAAGATASFVSLTQDGARAWVAPGPR